MVKAADGKTDLHGILYKPFDFDPDNKYPVIESIYAGPQVAIVPRTFTDWGVNYPQVLDLTSDYVDIDGLGLGENYQ